MPVPLNVGPSSLHDDAASAAEAGAKGAGGDGGGKGANRVAGREKGRAGGGEGGAGMPSSHTRDQGEPQYTLPDQVYETDHQHLF